MMEAHQIADEFPMQDEDEFASLVLSMRTHGFDPAKPIVLFRDEGNRDGSSTFRAYELASFPMPVVVKRWPAP